MGYASGDTPSWQSAEGSVIHGPKPPFANDRPPTMPSELGSGRILWWMITNFRQSRILHYSFASSFCSLIFRLPQRLRTLSLVRDTSNDESTQLNTNSSLISSSYRSGAGTGRKKHATKSNSVSEAVVSPGGQLNVQLEQSSIRLLKSQLLTDAGDRPNNSEPTLTSQSETAGSGRLANAYLRPRIRQPNQMLLILDVSAGVNILNL